MNTTISNQGRKQKRKYWQHHINAWQQSGMKQAVYCREHGIKAISDELLEKPFIRSRAESLIRPAASGIPSSRAGPSANIEVAYPNGFCIDVPGNFDPHVLRQLIATVKVL